ncbi:MAG: GNAT family N-acetyltransferase [Ruminococcaceae bacterium]|nr:GNAT family N-acetyltransferase [Oscillospiraceae bacterium]
MKLSDSEIIFTKCGPKHICDILSLQEKAFEHLEDASLLRRNSKEMLEDCLCEPHYTIGAFYQDKMIGFAIIYDGGNSEENLGRDLGIDNSKLKEVINMKLVIVDPEFRGNGLQRKMTSRLEDIARSRGKKIICATVSENNNYSFNNLLALGYEHKTTKIKYGNLKRRVYCKLL